MLFRKTVFALALAGAAVPAAFANTGNNNAVVREKGFETHTMENAKSRADVKKELRDFRNTPTTAETGTKVGGGVGDVGFATPQHSYAVQDGKLVHTDNLPHNTPKPSLHTRNVEPRLLHEQYINY